MVGEALERLGCMPALSTAGCNAEWSSASSWLSFWALLANALSCVVIVLSVAGSGMAPDRLANGTSLVVSSGADDTVTLECTTMPRHVEDADSVGSFSDSVVNARNMVRSVLRHGHEGLLLRGATDALLVAGDGRLVVRQDATPLQLREEEGTGGGAAKAVGAATGVRRSPSPETERAPSQGGGRPGPSRGCAGMCSCTETALVRLVLLGCVFTKALHDAIALFDSGESPGVRAVSLLLWTTHGVLGVSILVVHLRHFSLVLGVSDRSADVDSLSSCGQYVSLGVGIALAGLQLGLSVHTLVRADNAWASDGRAAGRLAFDQGMAITFFGWTGICFFLWAAFMLLSRALLDLLRRNIRTCLARKQQEIDVALTVTRYHASSPLSARRLASVPFETPPGSSATLGSSTSAHHSHRESSSLTRSELLRGLGEGSQTRPLTPGAASKAHRVLSMPSSVKEPRTGVGGELVPVGWFTRPADEDARSRRRACCCCLCAAPPGAGKRRGACCPGGQGRVAPETIPQASQTGSPCSAPGATSPVPPGSSDRQITNEVLERVQSAAVMLGYRRATVREVLTALDLHIDNLRRAVKSVRMAMWSMGGLWGAVTLGCLGFGVTQTLMRQSMPLFVVLHTVLALVPPTLTAIMFRPLLLEPLSRLGRAVVRPCQSGLGRHPRQAGATLPAVAEQAGTAHHSGGHVPTPQLGPPQPGGRRNPVTRIASTPARLSARPTASEAEGSPSASTACAGVAKALPPPPLEQPAPPPRGQKRASAPPGAIRMGHAEWRVA